ncbi:U5 small nuclear ribonucleoprotein TSSC4-like [Bolinopsis microptera]|uniref:U5 small nuclear ribonucleoprotein TSSC4-like n=1 Tax=Bolinopsis microptera TaxID=2820187 RepID=UPI0030796D01
MKLEAPKEEPKFTLFSPDTSLPTEERTQFRSRASDVFGSLSRDTVAPSDLTPAMAPPPAPRSTSRNESEKVNITPSIELYNSLTSDKVEKKRTPVKAPVRAFGSNKRFFRAQHEITPQKFTKYTLEDTDLTDDRDNKAIALSFLNDLKESKSELEPTPSSEGKIVFRKRARTSENQGDEEIPKGPSKHKNAVVQEEYVIGQTKSVSKKHARAAGVAPARADGVDPARQQQSRDSKSSGKGKERGRMTACYLDDEEED